jgi:integrase
MAKKRRGRQGNGEGSIRQRPDGTWEARVTTGYDSEGKPKRQSFYGKTRQEVAEKMNKALHEMSIGARLDVNKVTLSEWLDRWLIDYMKPSLRPNTYQSYEMDLRLHVKPYVGSIRLKDLQAGDLQRLFNNLLKNGRATEWNKEVNPGLSRRTVDYVRTTVKAALSVAVDNDLILKNPAKQTKLPPAEKKEAVPFTRRESETFLNYVKGIAHRLFAALYLAFCTGLRRGEILGLMWPDIDFEASTLEVKRELVEVRDVDTKKVHLDFGPPKTEKSKRTIPMTENMVKVLKAHLEKQDEERFFYKESYHDENLVFCTEDGRRIWPRNFDRLYTNLLKKAGVDHKKLHTTRHTFASMMIEDGEDIRNVQELLGHAVLSTTADIYSHVAERAKKKAMNRMQDLLNVPVD